MKENYILLDRTTNTLLTDKPIEQLKFRWELDKSEQELKQTINGEVYTPNYVINQMNKLSLVKLEQTYLEACCGLAPFINNRYDQIKGCRIGTKRRRGIFDKKIKQIRARLKTPDDFFNQVITILKTLYAFEFDREVLLLARIAMLDSISDYFKVFFKNKYDINNYPEYIQEIENVISWNFFTMDIFTKCIPNTDIPVKIIDWKQNKIYKFEVNEQLEFF